MADELRLFEVLNKVPTFNDIYPIGSIYMNINNTDPSTLFGGTWERIKRGYLTCYDEDSSFWGRNTPDITKPIYLNSNTMPTHDNFNRGWETVNSNEALPLQTLVYVWQRIA